MSPLVSLARQESYTELLPVLDSLLAPLGSMASIVRPGDRVLIKPNLLTGARPTKACTTDPALVCAVATLVQSVGGKPFLGDSPAFGTAQGVAKANGLWELASALDIPIVEFHGERYQIPEARTPELQHLRLCQEALGADVVINLPKLKSHMQLTLTLGVKNLFGCVPGKMKAWWHMEAGKDVLKFARMLVETARAINPQLTIMDGIIGHEGNGPSGGEPRQIGLLAASRDVFALDRVVAAILGVATDQVPTLMAADQMGVSTPEITIVGEPLANLYVPDWRLPDQLMPIDFGLPRVVRSIFKHLYIKFIKETLQVYVSLK